MRNTSLSLTQGVGCGLRPPTEDLGMALSDSGASGKRRTVFRGSSIAARYPLACAYFISAMYVAASTQTIYFSAPKATTTGIGTRRAAMQVRAKRPVCVAIVLMRKTLTLILPGRGPVVAAMRRPSAGIRRVANYHCLPLSTRGSVPSPKPLGPS